MMTTYDDVGRTDGRHQAIQNAHSAFGQVSCKITEQ